MECELIQIERGGLSSVRSSKEHAVFIGTFSSIDLHDYKFKSHFLTEEQKLEDVTMKR